MNAQRDNIYYTRKNTVEKQSDTEKVIIYPRKNKRWNKMNRKKRKKKGEERTKKERKKEKRREARKLIRVKIALTRILYINAFSRPLNIPRAKRNRFTKIIRADGE